MLHFGAEPMSILYASSPILWLIVAPNMNKINPFFSEISHEMHKIHDKFCMEPNAILHASTTHGT